MWQQAWKAGQRDLLLDQIKHSSAGDANKDVWDVVVAGGGITGAGIAREAARRGLKVLLVERQDFAWGTSSRSSKMVHGGLRYMAAGDVKTTLHSVRERERLMREAPGLVDQMGYLMAHYKGVFPGPFMFNALLRVYDFFAGKKYRKFHGVEGLEALSPSLNDQDLIGGTQFADAVTDDSRLVLRVLREAQKDGATVINYVGVRALIKDAGHVIGAELNDVLSGQSYQVKAKVVINATGAWADELRTKMGAEKKIRPARGSHVVVPSWRLPVAQAYTAIHPQDQRPIFIFPWEGRTVIGTTDLDNNGIDNTEPRMTRAELEYLLQVVAYQFPKAGIQESDVISSWAGVRPLVSSGALNPSKEKREHSVWNDRGLVTVSGGKLTTFRLIALDALEAASEYLPGVEIRDSNGDIFTKSKPTHPAFEKLPSHLKKRLQGHYGMDVDALLQHAKADELSVIPGAHALWAELRWAAANEAVMHLDDVLLRRTRIGLLVEQGGLVFVDKIKAICCDELQWSEAQWQQELTRYETIWARHYSVPVE